MTVSLADLSIGFPLGRLVDWPPLTRCRRRYRPNPHRLADFGKARSAQSGALLEDYVELISDLLTNGGEARPTDIARRLGVAHATAIKTIGRLKREGLAVGKPYRGVFLTTAGRVLPPVFVPVTAWWSTCCWRSAYRRKPRNRMPRASSTMSPNRPWPHLLTF